MAEPVEQYTNLITTGTRVSFEGFGLNDFVEVSGHHKSSDGQRGRWVVKHHCIGGDLEPTGPPTDVVPRGFGGQIGIVFTPPTETDYDQTLIYISRNRSELETSQLFDTQPTGSTRGGNWSSGIDYRDGIVYYVRLISLDTSGNVSQA